MIRINMCSSVRGSRACTPACTCVCEVGAISHVIIADPT